MICGDTHNLQVGVWVGWQVGSCQINKNQINLDLIEIIQFCLKLFDLCKLPTYGFVDGWGHVKSLKIE